MPVESKFNDYHRRLLLERQFSRDCEPTCRDFVSFCKQCLDITDKVNIQFIDNRDPDITTGSYNPIDRKILILSKDRALIDILRSIAHEIVHQHQHIKGELHSTSGDTGSDHENEAHALAGILMRKYHKLNSDTIY